MKKEWSKKWRGSKKRSKKRKYVFQAPLHMRHKFMSANLGKALRERIKKRSLPVREGDTVKITTGEFKKTTGKVTRVDYKRQRVFIEKVVRKKVDGSEVAVGVHPSNLSIIELNTEDRRRLKRLGAKSEKVEKKKIETKSADNKEVRK